MIKPIDVASASGFSALLAPRGIAVVGASADPSRIGGQPMQALVEFGYRGAIYPVNPRYPEIRGLRCYPDMASVPQPCDVALIAVPGKAVPDAIRQCGRAGVPFAVVLSAGFREIGLAGEELQGELDAAVAESGVRVVGPNCQGLLAPAMDVYCGFGAPFQYAHRQTGPVALVTQSGGFGFAVMGQSELAGIGFNYVVSTGNEADITALELISHMLERDDTEIVATYLEGVSDGRRLVELGRRAAELGKPILVWKVGNSITGRKAAASHTANLTAPYELFRAAFREGGFLEVHDVDDLVDIARAFMLRRLPQGRRVAVISISGGAGVLLADRCDALGLTLPALSAPTLETISTVLPRFSSTLNPVDVTAQVFNDIGMFSRVVGAVIADEAVDQVIVVTASVQGAMAERIARELAAISASTDKPVIVAASAPPERAAEALEVYAEHRIPVYPTPSRAAKGAAALADFAQKRDRAAARSMPVRPMDRQAIELPAGEGTLGEHRSKALIAAYGIPTVGERLLSFDDVEGLDSAPFAFPVVAKLESADLPHKSEAGAVRVGIGSLDDLKQAARQMRASASRYKPDARIDGVLVQEMARGLEVMAGAVNDPHFGPTILFGLGGIFAEAVRDVTHRFAPFDHDEARRMILEVRGAKLLQGFRGEPPLDIDALADTLSRLSWLAFDHADRIGEIDINPIFARPEGQGVVAADALVALTASGIGS